MGCAMSVEEKAALAISREIDRQIAAESTLRDVKLLLLGKCVCDERGKEEPPLTLSRVTPFTGRTELTLCSDYSFVGRVTQQRHQGHHSISSLMLWSPQPPYQYFTHFSFIGSENMITGQFGT